jgi:hypothetical protein
VAGARLEERPVVGEVCVHRRARDAGALGAGACNAESARPIPGQRAISSAGTPRTASAISR